MVDALPVIDQERCISCGLCIDICPDGILAADADGIPGVTADSCMGCGHCAAICPAEAVSMPDLLTDLELVNVSAPLRASRENMETGPLLHLMRSRRSCRAFKPDHVKLSLLTDLARIGTTAPSGTNCQGWQFILLPERRDVLALGELTAQFYRRLNSRAANPMYRLAARLFYGGRLENYYQRYYRTVKKGLADWYEKGTDRLFHGAPAAIVVVADSSSSCPGEDALLATQNMLLAAESMGIATCLIGFVVEAAKHDKKIAELLRLGSSETIYSVIGCGYAVHSFKRYAGRKAVPPRIVTIEQSERYVTSDKKAVK